MPFDQAKPSLQVEIVPDLIHLVPAREQAWLEAGHHFGHVFVERIAVTSILDASIDGGQLGDLYERRWDGEIDIRSIKSVMQMEFLRCKTPEMVHKEIWAHLLAYNLLRTAMAVAAEENGIEPRQVSFKGAKQAVTAFAPKIEAARPKDRPVLIDAMLTVIAYHRVGNRPGRWEPRATKRRPKHGARLNQTRAEAKLPENRRKWY
ncbi:MAG TPA: transposase [Isosphaeraceae bacterium]|nr:transposase [Isosphaeraceae bacterium]